MSKSQAETSIPPNPPKMSAKTKKKRKYRGKPAKKEKHNPAALPLLSKGQVSSNWEKMKKNLDLCPKKPKRPSFRVDDKARKFVKKPIQKKESIDPKPKPDIWFDDVDELLLDPEDRPGQQEKQVGDKSNTLVKDKSFKGLTKIIAMDCEMVGVGFNGSDSILARISIVNHFGNCIYDKFVKPTEEVTDYRTAVSGIRPHDIQNGEDFKVVQKEVSDMFNGRTIVGHSLHNDLKVLFLTHPRRMIRDTSTYKPFRDAFGGRTPSLKNLTARMLGVTVQEGEHSSVQDAQAAMRLYTMFRKEWEKSLASGKSKPISGKRKDPTTSLPNSKRNKPNGPKYVDSDDSDSK